MDTFGTASFRNDLTWLDLTYDDTSQLLPQYKFKKDRNILKKVLPLKLDT